MESKRPTKKTSSGKVEKEEGTRKTESFETREEEGSIKGRRKKGKNRKNDGNHVGRWWVGVIPEKRFNSWKGRRRETETKNRGINRPISRKQLLRGRAKFARPLGKEVTFCKTASRKGRLIGTPLNTQTGRNVWGIEAFCTKVLTISRCLKPIYPNFHRSKTGSR